MVAVVAALLVIGLTGSDDERPERQRGKAGKQRDRGKGDSKSGGSKGTVTLALSIHDPVEVCLLGGAARR